MSRADRDFEYKLFGRRLAWSMGYVPLINVPIRVPREHARRSSVDVTDADVLGFRFAADGSVSTFLADCRDTSGEAVDRVFWVKGLASYYRAEQVYVLKRRVTSNAAWLSERLGIITADSSQVRELQGRLRLDSLKGPYFDGQGYEALSVFAKELPKESPYRQVHVFLTSTLWAFSDVERLVSIIDIFNRGEMAKTFHPQDRLHQSLVLTAAFQLGLALGQILSRLPPTSLLQLEIALREALHGGKDAFRQKLKYARYVKQLPPNDDDMEALDLPSYVDLQELAYRLLAKRYALNDAIRFLDVVRHYHAVARPLPTSFKDLGSPLAKKFAHDILTTFVRANGLNSDFVQVLSSYSVEPVESEEAPEEFEAESQPLASISTMEVESSTAASQSADAENKDVLKSPIQQVLPVRAPGEE